MQRRGLVEGDSFKGSTKLTRIVPCRGILLGFWMAETALSLGEEREGALGQRLGCRPYRYGAQWLHKEMKTNTETEAGQSKQVGMRGGHHPNPGELSTEGRKLLNTGRSGKRVPLCSLHFCLFVFERAERKKKGKAGCGSREETQAYKQMVSLPLGACLL